MHAANSWFKGRIVCSLSRLEGIDTVGYFRKMIETWSRLNLAVYNKMVGGYSFSDCLSWRYGNFANGA